jgi:PEP-CTERM motif
MISPKVFQFLAGVGLGLGMLTAPTHAGVFRASTTFDLPEDAGTGTAVSFSLPQYSGPGAILGVNLALSGSAIGDDEYAYLLTDGITVAPYSNTWTFFINAPPPLTANGLLETSVTAKYLGVSIAPCTNPLCDGVFKKVEVITNSTPFSGSANLTDLSDFKGSGSNAFDLGIQIPPIGALDEGLNAGSATVTETILTSVPEPSTWAMALVGFAVLGFAARKARLGVV